MAVCDRGGGRKPARVAGATAYAQASKDRDGQPGAGILLSRKRGRR